MIKVELQKDDIYVKTVEIDSPMSIKEVVNGYIPEYHDILSFKVNNECYHNDTYEITADCLINSVTYKHLEGKRIYQDSVIFLMTKAFYNLFLNKFKVVVEHSIDDGVFCEVFGDLEFTEKDVLNIKQEMLRTVERQLWIDKISYTWKEALDILERQSRSDLIKNIDYYSSRTVNLYKCGEYHDFFSRPLADNTKNIGVFDVEKKNKGFILHFPQSSTFKVKENLVHSQKVFKAHQNHDKWLSLLGVHKILDINSLVDDYKISNFILHEEALHEKNIASIAEEIKQSNKKIILIAGPSSSGKTTFSHRLGVQLQVAGLKPIIIGLDDYFLDRTMTPRKKDGSYDFETIKALNLDLLNTHLKDLLDGKEVELPKYNFSRGTSENSKNFIKLGENDVIVMEGIHGLNPELSYQIPDSEKVKIYVTALNQLNIDNHNRIPTTDCRKLRRIVRDFYYRGYSAEETLNRWKSVRDGENKNIFPFQENADYIFNSSLTYELGCIKSHATKELKKIHPNSINYTEAKRLLLLLSFIKDIPEKYVPNNSIIREFIGGSCFRG